MKKARDWEIKVMLTNEGHPYCVCDGPVPKYGEPPVLVREVLPINWEKIWRELDNHFRGFSWDAHTCEPVRPKTQELVERALRGEL